MSHPDPLFDPENELPEDIESDNTLSEDEFEKREEISLDDDDTSVEYLGK